MRVKVPIPFYVTVQGTLNYRGDPINLRLPDANLWIIEAGIDVGITRSFKLYLSGAGNLVQNLLTRWGGYVDSDTETHLRKSHPLDWLEADAAISYFFRDPFAVVVGLRWDHFDLTIRDPGAISRGNAGPYSNTRILASDVLSNLWIPYLGIEFARENFRLRLFGSSIGWAHVNVRTRLKGDIAPSHDFLAQSVITMTNSPYFVEAKIEYEVSLAKSTNINFWGKGGWLGSKGGGRLESAFSSTDSGLTLGILDDRNVAYDRYSLSGGIAVKTAF
ncbi:MAG: hypothetical protein HY912_09500 [Desulfomonile tiedjei]|uniref:Uncharacterized protein n=1 Tax=Desulfomonile tiedjei TaxID=2358 RepID=A0A9D6Z099_9BACT|nr:hypothetical protein [Desulfomonile tiedjei]